MKRRTGELQIFSLSFMDLLSCALGGILLLYLALINNKKKEAEAYLSELSRRDEQAAKVMDLLADAQSSSKSFEEKLDQLQKAQNTLVGFKGNMKNVVFVFDHSGSMATNNFPDYVKLLKSYVSGLPFERYSIVMFGHEISSLSSTLIGNSQDDRQKGTQFIDQFKADGKCTATLPALKAAFAIDGVDTIVIMTDGAPTRASTPGDYSRLSAVSTQSVLDGVKQLNVGRAVTINTVAMGDYFRTNNLGPFLQQLAHDNGGEFIGR